MREEERIMDRLYPLEEKHALLEFCHCAFCFLCLHVVAYLVDTQCRQTRLRYHFLWLSFILRWTFLSVTSPGIWYKRNKRGLIHGYMRSRWPWSPSLKMHYKSYLLLSEDAEPNVISFVFVALRAYIQTPIHIITYMDVPLSLTHTRLLAL